MANLDTTIPAKAGSSTWIGLGYFFAVLGGIVGIAIGHNYRSSKYNEQTRRHGLYILIIGYSVLFLGRMLLSGRR